MAKKTGRKKLKKEVRTILAFAVSFVIVMSFYILVHQLTKFDYQKNLNQIVLSVADTNISLKEISYYVMLVERTGNESAKQYNQDNLSAYWGLYMNQGTETGYVTDLAKQAVIDFCIRDNIYAMEAAHDEIDLSQEEMEELRYDAESTYSKMTAREKEVTGLTVADLEIIMYKEQLAHKYMILLANSYENGALEAITLLYDVGGTYYEGVKFSYPIEVNEKLWKNVKIGHITIN